MEKYLNDNGHNDFNDTIAAISTPPGEGGIGIVRLSGPLAFNLVEKIFEPRNKGNKYPRSHRIYYGRIYGDDKEIIDEVLVSFMRAPRTYTREDTVEINCHSGAIVLKIILELVIKQGARMAEPGEFTKRAYINGRIDLGQAESVINIIRAKSEKAVISAGKIISGELTEEIKSIMSHLFNKRIALEANLDFPEDDVETMEYSKIEEELYYIHDRIKKLYYGAQKGVIFQEGLKISLVGKVNVGKSSLLNNLLQKQRAIVTEIPGTTRDTLEEVIELGGVPVRIIDTAGIRKTDDPIEQIGVDRAINAAEVSDINLLLLDGVTGIENADKEIINSLSKKHKQTVVAVNKIDLANQISEKEIKNMIPESQIFLISAVKGTGIRQLENYLGEYVNKTDNYQEEHPLVISQRHKDALKEAEINLRNALDMVKSNGPLDLISWDIQATEEKLGEITGETISKDVLDEIFKNFCIGK